MADPKGESSQPVSVRLGQEERKVLAMAASRKGLGLSAFLREAGLAVAAQALGKSREEKPLPFARLLSLAQSRGPGGYQKMGFQVASQA